MRRSAVLCAVLFAVAVTACHADDSPPPPPLTLKEVMDKQAASLAKVKIAADALKKARTQADRTAAEGDYFDAKTASQKEMAEMRGLPIQLVGTAVSVGKAPADSALLITVHVGNDVLVLVRASAADWPDLKRRDKIRLVGKIAGMYPPGPPGVSEAKPDTSPEKKEKPADKK